jgi:hypothetical protein
MNLEEGKIVWTCQPPIESDYDELPRKPREVKLSLRHGIWYGYG